MSNICAINGIRKNFLHSSIAKANGISQVMDCPFDDLMLGLSPILLQQNATYTRNSVKHVLQNGALVQLAANQFGTSYDLVTGLYGYLPETAATNLALYSEDISNAAWAKSACTLGPISSVAGIPAYPIVEDLALASHRVISTNMALTSGQGYSFQVMVRANGRDFVNFRANNSAGDLFSVVVKISTAEVVSTSSGSATASIISSNGDVLIKAYGVSGATANTAIYIATLDDATINNHTGDGVSGIYATAVQCETGTYASSYIKTTTGTATRSADVLTVPLANVAGFKESQYTLVADFRSIASAAAAGRIISLDDNTADNESRIGRTGTPQTNFAIASGGATSANIVKTVFSTDRVKVAGSASVNNMLASFNGVAGTPDLVCPMPVSPTKLRIGCSFNSTTQPNGYIYSAKLITTPLTQSQLNAITTL